jgi:hypothetical protein
MAAQPLSPWGEQALASSAAGPAPADASVPPDEPWVASGRPAWRWGRLESMAEEPDSERAVLLADLLHGLLPLVAGVVVGGLLLGLALRWAP